MSRSSLLAVALGLMASAPAMAVPSTVSSSGNAGANTLRACLNVAAVDDANLVERHLRRHGRRMAGDGIAPLGLAGYGFA